MSKQHVTLLVLLDISAACDTIDHGKLVKRLKDNLGVSGVAFAWFKSYLSDRSYRHDRTSVAGVKSGNFTGIMSSPFLFTI